MGQKIHPICFRLALTKKWWSRWYATDKDFSGMLHQDIKVRQFLYKRLSSAAVGRILIERPAKNARITIYSARPGVVIGKKGEDIEVLKTELQKMLGGAVHLNIEEIRKPELDAQLIADSITQQLEKRIMFRRAMKRAMTSAMRSGAQGIKIMSAGRLNGIEIARTEWYREGRVPLHTLRADIDYATSEAETTYGIIGVKVWIYRGDTVGKSQQGPLVMADEQVVEDKRPKKRDQRALPRKPRQDGHGKSQENTARPVEARNGGGAKPARSPKSFPAKSSLKPSVRPANKPTFAKAQSAKENLWPKVNTGITPVTTNTGEAVAGNNANAVITTEIKVKE